MVIKEGNQHCGKGVAFLQSEVLSTECIVEPFFEGRSERVLRIGKQVFRLRYESEDWRKNVNGSVRVLTPSEIDLNDTLNDRVSFMLNELGLDIAGVDFIIHGDTARLLEVNAYPGLDDAPEAQSFWLSYAVEWWRQAMQTGGRTVLVNGLTEVTTAPFLSYEDVVRMAHPDMSKSVHFTIVYRKGTPQHPSGTLDPGKRVKVHEGMIFNAFDTSGA